MRYGEPKLSGKMQVLEQVLGLWKARGDRVLVFCQTRQMLDIVQARSMSRIATYDLQYRCMKVESAWPPPTGSSLDVTLRRV